MANNINSCSSDTIATRTNLRAIKFRHEWQTSILSGSDTYSPAFTTQGYERYQWKIHFKYISDEYFLSLKFVGTEPEVKAFFRFNISGETGPFHPTECKRDVDVVNFKPNQESGFDKFYRSNSNEHIFGDVNLVIHCEGYVLIEDGNYRSLKNPQYDFNQKFVRLLYTDKFSDVKFIVDDHELSAHRAILADRSEVFAAMFEREIKENKSGPIIITDFKPEVIEEMLHYIYTGEAPNLAKMAGDLLAAADKYALKNLKETCEISLCNQLSLETAIQTLILANLHGVDELKTKAIDFICTHAPEIMNTQPWKNAIAEHSHLIATELSELILQYQTNKMKIFEQGN